MDTDVLENDFIENIVTIMNYIVCFSCSDAVSRGV